MYKEFERISPKDLQKTGVEHGVPAEAMRHLFDHEYYGHYMNDAKRQGEFGLIITSGWVVAYYMIIGEREPEELMDIAAGPGMGKMSRQDWSIYNKAWGDLLQKLQEEEFELKEKGPVKEGELDDVGVDPDDLKIRVIDAIKEKLDLYAQEGNFPRLSDLYNTNLSDFFREHGKLIGHAFDEAIAEVMRDSMFPDGDETTVAENDYGVGVTIDDRSGNIYEN